MDAPRARDMNTPEQEKSYPAVLTRNLGALVQVRSALHETLAGFLPVCDYAADIATGITLTHDTQTYVVPKHTAPDMADTLAGLDNRNSVCLLIGIGSGHELHEIVKRTGSADDNKPIGSALPIYVLEPDPCAVLAVFCAHDLSTALRSGRLLIWTGADALDHYIARISEDRQAMFPTQHFVYLPAHAAAFAQQAVAGINRLTEATTACIADLETAVNDYYAGMDKSAWRRIYTEGNRPLRVLGCTSRFTTYLQYCMRDLLSGFDKLGCATQLHQENSNITRTTKYDLLATIDAFKPDLIIYIDHFRDEYPYFPANIPFLNWIQDLLPDISNPAARKLNPLDLTCVFVPQWIDTLKANPVYREHDISLLPLGINPDIYHPQPETAPEFEVLYVSHLPAPATTLMPLRDTGIAFEPNAEEAELLHGGGIDMERLLVVYLLMMKTLDGLLIDDLWRYVVDPKIRRSFVLRNLQRAEIAENETLVEYFCRSTRVNQDIMLAVKYRPMRALIENGFAVRVYGRNWEAYPGIGQAAHGIAENGAPLNTLMNQARICINNSPGTTFHMRALEILGSGSFMLTRRIPFDAFDITDYFEKDREIFFFANEIDVVSSVRKFLADEALRTSLAEQTCRKAIADLGYDKTAGHILEKAVAMLAD